MRTSCQKYFLAKKKTSQQELRTCKTKEKSSSRSAISPVKKTKRISDQQVQLHCPHTAFSVGVCFMHEPRRRTTWERNSSVFTSATQYLIFFLALRLVMAHKCPGARDNMETAERSNQLMCAGRRRDNTNNWEKMNGHIQAGHLNDKARNSKSLDTARSTSSHPQASKIIQTA